MRFKSVTITKPEEGALNEDAVVARDGLIAVADGAGGGGVFTEVWSHYLLEHLPPRHFGSFAALDEWVDSIWEQYYNRQESVAKQMNDPMLLGKFYDEGSFATLVAIWHEERQINWVTYGDSAAFCYNRATGKLSCSCGTLADFNKAPYLISCKDPLPQDGFQTGQFDCSASNIYFVASDAIAHYLLMMYMVAHKERFETELREALSFQSKNANFIKTALSMKTVEFGKVLRTLLNCVGHEQNIQRHLAKLRKIGLLAVDDYSIAMMWETTDDNKF